MLYWNGLGLIRICMIAKETDMDKNEKARLRVKLNRAISVATFTSSGKRTVRSGIVDAAALKEILLRIIEAL